MNPNAQNELINCPMCRHRSLYPLPPLPPPSLLLSSTALCVDVGTCERDETTTFSVGHASGTSARSVGSRLKRPARITSPVAASSTHDEAVRVQSSLRVCSSRGSGGGSDQIAHALCGDGGGSTSPQNEQHGLVFACRPLLGLLKASHLLFLSAKA
jgi:hypothetical protein